MSYQLMLFPGFKEKALTFSYDDGTRSDIKLAGIFNKYDLKATFNLCSGLLNAKNYICKDEIRDLYLVSGHEIAIHGTKHLSLSCVPETMAVEDIWNDRKTFEELTGRMIRGMAYANGAYNDKIVELLKSLGISYARTITNTGKFEISNDFLRLHPTCHHDDPKLFELADKFLIDYNESAYYWSSYPKLFYIWGHSYEFDGNNNWDRIEEFAKKMSGRTNVWYATNGEIVDYIKSYDELIFSAAGNIVYNPTSTDIYMRTLSRARILIPAGKTVNL